MNEYTRREEVRATFIASAILVLCIAGAVFRLVMVQGKLVPDPVARRAAQESEVRVTAARTCAVAGEKFVTEIDVFKKLAKSARLNAPPEAPPPRRWGAPPRPRESEDKLSWTAAQAVHKQATTLANCREPTEATVGSKPDAAAAWKAIGAAAAIAPPDEKNDQATLAANKKMYEVVGEIPADKIAQATREAEQIYRTQAERDKARAETAVIREPLPEGILSRRAAVSIGVALTVIALLISYVSVRVASMRRLATLVPLRAAARTGSPGTQAASILKAAAAHNGGEPGIVIGSAIGGLCAALLQPADADLFVAGVMAGLLLGLALQWVVRLGVGASRWRARAAELSEIEKPAIPIVLVLSGVNQGLEAQFIQYLRALSVPDAATAVEKLASQAEERILAAADADAAAAAQRGQPM